MCCVYAFKSSLSLTGRQSNGKSCLQEIPLGSIFCAVQRLAGGCSIPGADRTPRQGHPGRGGRQCRGSRSGRQPHLPGREEQVHGTWQSSRRGCDAFTLSRQEGKGEGPAAKPPRWLCTGCRQSCKLRCKDGETRFRFASSSWQEVLPVKTVGKAISDRNVIYCLKVSLWVCKLLGAGIMFLIRHINQM